jgi:hypothetical protein
VPQIRTWACELDGVMGDKAIAEGTWACLRVARGRTNWTGVMGGAPLLGSLPFRTLALGAQALGVPGRQ